MLGISRRSISDTPIAVVDFETTGLTPGYDRVVEVSVVRIDPGEEPKLVFDTLVNPMRRVAATEIHGITDEDVADAPHFADIAGEIVGALNGCAVAAYNVYFDIKFLATELQNASITHEPPYFCLMYLRPMLGLGSRCKLDEACREHGIAYEAKHIASSDAEASGKLLCHYLKVIEKRGVKTFGDLANLKKYKFVDSFDNNPFPHPSVFRLSKCEKLRSRSKCVNAHAVDQNNPALTAYWDTIKDAVADLEITDDEAAHILLEKTRLKLRNEQIRFVHAETFSNAIAQYTNDKWLDENEVRKLRRLYACLSKIGWAPGQ